MPTVRFIRRSRGLTLVDVALLTDIPVRDLAEIECGLRPLDPDRRERLAAVFGVPAGAWQAALHPVGIGVRLVGLQHVVPGVVIALVCAILITSMWLDQQPAPASAAAPLRLTRSPIAPTRLTPAITPSAAAPTPLPAKPIMVVHIPPPPTPWPTPVFTLAADGPHGCPLAVPINQIVMTQGYAIGTHAPASVWGGVDLAVDGDGDGRADPDASQGRSIVATRGGIAQVYMDTWPAGNYVRIIDQQTGWSVAYAHLSRVAVADGQAVEAGTLLGDIGSTGYTSGPHLHYEVWRGKENVDPSGLIECGRPETHHHEWKDNR